MHFSQIISEHGFSPLWKYILPWLCLYASSVCRRLQEREFFNLILYTLFSFREDLEDIFIFFYILFHVYITHIYSSGIPIKIKEELGMFHILKRINLSGSEIPFLC